jgi:hypothetical protein
MFFEICSMSITVQVSVRRRVFGREGEEVTGQWEKIAHFGAS